MRMKPLMLQLSDLCYSVQILYSLLHIRYRLDNYLCVCHNMINLSAQEIIWLKFEQKTTHPVSQVSLLIYGLISFTYFCNEKVG